MTSDELKQELNNIDDRVSVNIKKFNPMSFNGVSVKKRLNQYVDKLTVEIIKPEGKNILLFTLLKSKYGSTNRWKLDTRSSNPAGTIEFIDFYIKALKVTQDFMEVNNAD